MHWKSGSWILVGVLLAALTTGASAQIVTTMVADTIYHADGTAATGTVLISWPAFTTATGESVPSGSTAATIGGGGALSVNLAPNAGSTPMGSYYTVVYHLDDGSVSRQYWVVPVSAATVKVSSIESTVLPTSVAMQTVSKSYVDTAIAAAVTGHPLDSTPYVLKAGDTMTGPLLLPGDPTAAMQAADKNYVDESVAGVAGGIGQKVSTLPAASQTVAQPVGTQLDVNNLSGVEYASQYVTGRGNNGIANATTGPDCANGCTVQAEPDYTPESYATQVLNPQTHIQDARGGRQVDSYKDPLDVVSGGLSTAQAIDDVATQSEASIAAATHNSVPGAIGLAISQEGLAGGSNIFPEHIQSQPPYFKMGYSALMVTGSYNTQGQHGLVPETIDCFGVGDCLIGSHFIYASGGVRDNADEGAHPFDLQTHEDSRVFVGTCASGCTAGSTSLMLTATANPGTQGDGRFLIDTNPANTITSGTIVGGSASSAHATAQFSGTNFPVGTFLSTGQVIPTQAANMAPGTVTFAIATSGMPAGYASNTAALPTTSGLACVVDQTNGYQAVNFEMAPYTVVDATHLQMTLNKPHQTLATIAVGGLCGYGLEQTVDTTNGVRQVFPVIGAYSATGLYYSAATTAVVGAMNQTSAYLNVNTPIVSAVRAGNTVTVTTNGNLGANVNGLTVTIAGVADSSYSGNYLVTTTGSNTFTYAQNGSNSSSSGGTVSIVTGGFALYPMAEVLSVFDANTRAVDGQMTLAPNNVAWAPSDPVEEPHYYQEQVTADIEYLGQYVPRPTVQMRAGLQYELNNGPGVVGWSITNASPAASYVGYGGTHGFPTQAYESRGVWQRDMVVDAGEQAVFGVHCNLHGCGNWNSGYNLFELESNVGTDAEQYAPQTSTLTWNMRGTPYSFTPQAFTAGTINAATLNVGTLNGALSAASVASGTIAAARLPLFGPSGSAHAAGIVPDPGAIAGSTRYLREDGTWDAPAGGGTASFAGVWTAGTTYTAGQAVSYATNGNSYISLANGNVGNEPDTAPAAWGLLAAASPITTASMTAAIDSAVSTGVELPMSYATMGSTTAAVGASDLTGASTISFGTQTQVLPGVLPQGAYIESIALHVQGSGNVAVLLGTFDGANAPSNTFTVTNRLTLNTANAIQTSPGVYQWTAPANYPMTLVVLPNTHLGIVNAAAANPGLTQMGYARGSGQGSGYYEVDGDIGGVGAGSTVYGSEAASDGELDASVYTRVQPPVPTPGEVQETRTLRVAFVKGYNLAAGGSLTLFSASGAGNVERIQIAAIYGGQASILPLGANTTITIAVDGQSYTCPLGLFLLWDGYTTADNASGATDLFASKYLSITSGGSTGTNSGSRRIYIRYNSSIAITINNTTATNIVYYSQVEYYAGTAPAGRFPATRNVFHMAVNNLAALAPNTTLSLLPAVSGAGELESIYFVSNAPGAVEPHWLEVNPILTVDGTNFQYGGTEDFFGNQFYGDQFHARTDEYGIARYFSSGAPDNTTYWSGYRYFRASPLIFNASLAAQWTNTDTGDGPAAEVGSLAVYYTQN